MSQGGTASLADQITSGPSIFNLSGGRQPTLAECEAIIRRLQQINEQQQHEVCVLYPVFMKMILDKV